MKPTTNGCERCSDRLSAGVFVVTGLLSLFADAALAHDLWISREHRTNPLNGRWCCNEHDCRAISDTEVDISPGGCRLRATDEFVPHEEAQASGDGQYWVCRIPGDGPSGRSRWKVRCFFFPPGGV